MSREATTDCRRKALDLLARRPHFRAELGAKLAARGFEPADIEAVLDGLTDSGYLDDLRAAVDLLRGPLRRRRYGRRRLRFELLRRGVEEEVAEEALRSAADEPELEVAREAARRWRSGGGRRPDALARHLDRRGFAAATIARILAEADPIEPGSG